MIFLNCSMVTMISGTTSVLYFLLTIIIINSLWRNPWTRSVQKLIAIMGGRSLDLYGTTSLRATRLKVSSSYIKPDTCWGYSHFIWKLNTIPFVVILLARTVSVQPEILRSCQMRSASCDNCSWMILWSTGTSFELLALTCLCWSMSK